MCGIVGLVTKKEKENTIKLMSDRIKHRGPDGDGYFIDGDVALGHRRLSIIDLSSGDQPMFNEDGSVVTVFNGEIYNYQELKEELIALGHDFKTKSDTEVLVHGYEEWHTDLPKHLRGMFAFAIYDKNKNEVFLARDNFGIKPLYFAKMNDTFMFASEIKAFLDVPDFEKIFNESILETYLEFSFVPTNETFFKGVHRLDAGCSLLYKDGEIKLNKYFKLDFKEENMSFEEAVKNISDVMKDSVEKHLIADVEVGSFLSSGIDSSYIVSLAKPDKTYTVGYENKKYDETMYAKDLAEKLGIKNESKIITKEEYLENISKIMYHLDEPTSDPAAISLYFVAKLASKDLKVVLSGEGADEFFGGYNYYREEVDYKFYNKLPYCVRHVIGKIASIFPEGRGFNFLVRRGEKLENSYIGVNRNFSSKMAKKVLKNNYELKAIDVTKDVYNEFKNYSNIDKMQAIDINFWLMKDILLKADRMTMASSIEGRVPFIDKEVFKVASHLPFDYKVTKENTKVALRAAAKEVIPTEAYKKKKLGFPVPVREWIKEGDFKEEVEKTLNSDVANKYFNTKIINKMFEEHVNGKKDNYRKIWTIYTFIKWYQVFFEGE
ncbi:asparagine synthase (glutamine-hydrolyzing) [bacterium]|nr:asparagine synthase (glutamine-hydrolyzing) [bacterium]